MRYCGRQQSHSICQRMSSFQSEADGNFVYYARSHFAEDCIVAGRLITNLKVGGSIPHPGEPDFISFDLKVFYIKIKNYNIECYIILCHP